MSRVRPGRLSGWRQLTAAARAYPASLTRPLCWSHRSFQIGINLTALVRNQPGIPINWLPCPWPCWCWATLPGATVVALLQRHGPGIQGLIINQRRT